MRLKSSLKLDWLVGQAMKIEKITVSGLNSAMAAIGLSYGDEYDPFKVSTKKLANTLVSRGVSSGEANFLVGARVGMTITASIKWWQQAQRYHWFDIVMSQGLMHCVAKRNWTFAEGTPKEVIEAFENRVNEFYDALQKKEKVDKNALIYSVPVGLEERARVNTNYLQLLNMYKQRKNHALPEWKEFCRVVETLPRMKVFLKALGLGE